MSEIPNDSGANVPPADAPKGETCAAGHEPEIVSEAPEVVESSATAEVAPEAAATQPEAGALADAGKGTVTGVVVEALPNTLFRVELAEGGQVLSYLAGKMRIHRIRVLVGDRVEVIKDPYGGKARVVRRL